MTGPWTSSPTVDLDLDVDIARRFDVIAEPLVAAGRALLEFVTNEMPAQVTPLADLVRLRTGGRFHDEAVTLARRAEVDWRSVILANVSYDLALAQMGCSTVALATADGPILARNMDWWPEDALARATIRTRYVRGGETRLVTAGWPGAIGVVTGVSHRGFAVAINAVLGPDGVDRAGYPVLLHLRRVLEDASSYEHAVKLLSRTRLAAPALFTVVGRENNERVVVERSPSSYALRRPRGLQPLVTTNEYRRLGMTRDIPTGDGLYATSCARYERLTELTKDYAAVSSYGDGACLYVLTDPTVLQEITAEHVILRPRDLDATGVYVPTRLLAG